MAYYTIELGRLLETGFDIGLDDYPIFDPAYREKLNTKIIDHFRFREIGLETPAMFRFFLNRRLREIMPYYNDLYRSTLYEFNPLHNTDIETTSNTKTTGTDTSTADATSSGTSVANARGRNLESATPQTQLSGVEDYASGIVDSVSDSTSTTTGENASTTESESESVTDYVTRVAGYSGLHPADAIMAFRQSLLNVDLMVLDELEPLFMQLYKPEMRGE